MKWKELRAATVKATLAVSSKAEHTLTVQSSSHTPRCSLKCIKHLGPHKTCTPVFIGGYSSLSKRGSKQDVCRGLSVHLQKEVC